MGVHPPASGGIPHVGRGVKVAVGGGVLLGVRVFVRVGMGLEVKVCVGGT